MGFAKGDRVGVWSPNRYEWLLAQFATARLGAILVNINPAYRVFELEYALNKVACKGLITARRFKSSDYASMLAELAPELADADPGDLKAAKLPRLEAIICMGDEIPAGMLAFDNVVASGRAVDEPRLGVVGHIRIAVRGHRDMGRERDRSLGPDRSLLGRIPVLPLIIGVRGPDRE